MPEPKKYCAFVDVRGYGNLVNDKTIEDEQKIKSLISIYESIAGSVSFNINLINENSRSKIFIRSFSDCFYLECWEVRPLFTALNRIFNDVFGCYSFFSIKEERTPLLRCGIVKDWTIPFRDIGAMVNKTTELNPVGLGVARAYWTSEKTSISGMRIIIAPEVMDDLEATGIVKENRKYNEVPIIENEIAMPYYFKHIESNEKNESVNLFELIWSYSGLHPCNFLYVDELEKLKVTFNDKTKRHLVGTAQILLDGLLLTDCRSASEFQYNIAVEKLKRLINV
jgi:hypothetical protein